MAKRNSSGPSSGNRKGSSRSTGKFSDKKSPRSSDRFDKEKPRKTSFSKGSENKDSEPSRPAGRFDKEGPRKSSFGKSSDARDRKSGGSSGRFNSEKPRKTSFGKDSNDRKSFGSKPFDRSEEKPRRSSFKKDDRSEGSEHRSSNRSFNKFDKKDDSKRSSFDRGEKKFSRDKGSNENPYRSTHRKDEERSEDRPRKAASSKSSFSSTPLKKYNERPPRAEETSGEGRPARYSSSSRYGSGGKPFKKGQSTKREADEKRTSDPDKIRLNRYIANSGICSRREADEFITMGLVSVNGKVITELGYKVNRSDEVRYESKVLKAEKPVYILMNKPKGYITTTKDPEERKTVMHILGVDVKERVYPVGRLDRNTTGLLLLTNDGDLADKLMHPSYNVKKIYKVELDRPLTKADFQKVRDGVRLEEGKTIVDDLAIASDDGKTIGIEIHIGWNRVVRRIFESLEYEVVKLDRTSYAGLDKKDLPRGHWRYLKKEEVVHLKHFK